MNSLHIFRNRYERKLSEYRPRNCVPAAEDYPELEDLMNTIRERFI